LYLTINFVEVLLHALLNGFSLFVCLRWLIDVFVSLCIVPLSITAFMLSMFGFLSHLFFLFRFPWSGRFWLPLISDCSNLVVPNLSLFPMEFVCLNTVASKQQAITHDVAWAAFQQQNAAEASLLWSGKQVSLEDSSCGLDVDGYDVVLITKGSSSWWFYDRWLFSPD